MLNCGKHGKPKLLTEMSNDINSTTPGDIILKYYD